MLDHDGLNKSDDPYRHIINSLAADEDHKRRKLHNLYAQNSEANYIEYQRRKGTLKFKP